MAAVRPPDKSSLDLPVRLFKTDGAWEKWLARNGETSPGIWLRVAKKAAKLKSITISDALDVALCYGWIDGQSRSWDDESFVQRFTPRRKKSIWSKINRVKVTGLIESGRMQPAGHAAIEAAKADGRWDAAYDSPRTAEVPEDLQAELDANPDAKAFFATISSQNRYAILFRIQTAKKPETKSKRIKEFVGMLTRKETFYP